MATTKANPLNNVWNFLGGSLNFQGHEKALKTALYNALAMLLLVICSAAVYALYFILDPFIKPLIWALLLGSVLHPFKYSLVSSVKSWLDVLENSGTPIPIAFFMIPINALDRVSDQIGDLIYQNLKAIFISSIALSLFLLFYGYVPQTCICFAWRMIFALYSTVNWMISFVSNPLLVASICGYLSALTLWWNPSSSVKFHIVGCIIWEMVACAISQLVGPSYQFVAFVAIQILFLFGFVYEKWMVDQQGEGRRERHLSIVECLMASTAGSALKVDDPSATQSLPILTKTECDDNEPQNLQRKAENEVLEENLEDEQSSGETAEGLGTSKRDDECKGKKVDSNPKFEAAYHRQEKDKTAIKPVHSDAITSERCLYVLGWTCLALFIWNHMWLLHFLPIPVSVYIIKHSGHYFGIWGYMAAHMDSLRETLFSWCSSRQSAFYPSFISGLMKIQFRLRMYIIHSLRDSVDSAASILVILALLIFVASTTIFISVNVYAEGIHLVQVAGNVINSTLTNNQEILALLPEGVQDKLHLVLDNAYLYGRQSISNMVNTMLKNVDASKAEQLEQRVLELWDRVYQAWMMTAPEIPGAMGPKVSSSAVYASWESFLDGLQKTPELLNWDGLIEFAKENVGTLSSLLESLWDILKGNVSLVFHSSLALFSVVLGGGSAVINFLISSVVFFTALFYLLSSSGSLYRPVEMVASFSPSSGNQVAVAIDGAVGDVFRASFKMAVFHGLWAWLVHTLFQVKVVYLPSVLASILGVVPFLGTYWACIPAVLELWLAQGRSMQALFMILAFYIPTSWVNGLVYEEIKGGHPYLTGLSVAGGVYCMGSEGAIFGPLLLCCVFVVLNISSSLMKEPSLIQLSPINMLR